MRKDAIAQTPSVSSRNTPTHVFLRGSALCCLATPSEYPLEALFRIVKHAN